MIGNPTTIFSQDKAGAFADRALAGNIGFGIVSRFRTILDYGRRRMILEPSAKFAEPFDRASTGMALAAEGADYRTFPREAGARELSGNRGRDSRLAGDIIASINGVGCRGADADQTQRDPRTERSDTGLRFGGARNSLTSP